MFNIYLSNDKLSLFLRQVVVFLYGVVNKETY